jgi:ElaB/YqjD/DUF883 family membrane-anchored ribosome-binding protein
MMREHPSMSRSDPAKPMRKKIEDLEAEVRRLREDVERLLKANGEAPWEFCRQMDAANARLRQADALADAVDYKADVVRMSNYRSNAETYHKAADYEGLYWIIREMLDDFQRLRHALDAYRGAAIGEREE